MTGMSVGNEREGIKSEAGHRQAGGLPRGQEPEAYATAMRLTPWPANCPLEYRNFRLEFLLKKEAIPVYATILL